MTYIEVVKMRYYALFSSVFLTILQIFSFKVTLIRDQGWIKAGAYAL